MSYSINDGAALNSGTPLFAYGAGGNPANGSAPVAALDFSYSLPWAPGLAVGSSAATPQAEPSSSSQSQVTYSVRLVRKSEIDKSDIWETDEQE